MELVLIGVVLILIGFVLVFLGAATQAGQAKGEVRGAGVALIGPVPIGFGTDRDALMAVLVLAIVISLIWMFLVRF